MSGHNLLYMRSDVSNEMSQFWLPSSGRRRLLLKVPSNTTPTMPAAAPIKETWKFQESWKEKYKWLHFDEYKNKMFCVFAGNFQMEKNTHYSWGLEQITFRPIA